MSLYTCILHALRVLYDRETLVEPCYMSEKAYNCSVGSYEPFHLVNGRVRVGAIPTQRVGRLSDIQVNKKFRNLKGNIGIA